MSTDNDLTANKRSESKNSQLTTREIIDRYSPKLINNSFPSAVESTKGNDLYENRILPTRPMSYDSIWGLSTPLSQTGATDIYNLRPLSSFSNHSIKENHNPQLRRNSEVADEIINESEKPQLVTPRSTFQLKHQSPIMFKKLPEFEELPHKSSFTSNSNNNTDNLEEKKKLFDVSNQNSDDDNDQVPKMYLQSSFTSGEVSLEDDHTTEKNGSTKKSQEEDSSDFLFSVCFIFCNIFYYSEKIILNLYFFKYFFV